MSYNKVILIGNLTRDPELKATPKGNPVCQFGLAVNRKSKVGDEVTFVDIEAWGNTAENIAKFFIKGKPILIEGRLKLEQWEDKTSGQKRSKLKVVADNFSFIAGGKDAPQDESQAPYQGGNRPVFPVHSPLPTEQIPALIPGGNASEDSVPF